MTDLAFTVNGAPVRVDGDPARRLADVLREDLRLTGTKIGCDAGDCGACTVLMDGRQACACLVPIGQAAGCAVTTVEGLATNGALCALQDAFLRHGAVQCGICTPGMLMAAADLLSRIPHPTESQALDALGGVLCRCTGYRSIVAAVLDAAGIQAHPTQAHPTLAHPTLAHQTLAHSAEGAVGARLLRRDGAARVSGATQFGADARPQDMPALVLRAIRSPHPHARFTLGDTDALPARHPGLVRVLTARDVPGCNLFGIYPTGKDQPVLADGYVRHRGEPVCALVGDAAVVARITDADLGLVWQVLEPVGFDAALTGTAPQLHAHAEANVLCRGRVACGDVADGLARGAVRAGISVETGFVEHAYIEPEAGYARRVGDRIEVLACTQAPYMDRDEIAGILGIAPDQVRVIPTATGGGFGGKLDLSLQPLICTAAWLLDRPVRMTYTRPESMVASTKRHPARVRSEAAADADGRLTGFRSHGDFNTGAYASWGPTVANRVPVHAAGPYLVPHALCTSTAIHTTDPPAGAFRGFGVPQAALAGEALMDMLAAQLGIDALEFRHRNALRPGDATTTGQVLGGGAALAGCLDALRPDWAALRDAAARFNRDRRDALRQGVGIACMWYGIGNTSLSNPSAMEIALRRDGRFVLYSGALDIGQGSDTIMLQIAAEALGVPMDTIDLVAGDTDLTRDAGKTSASRQTFVSGNAVRIAAAALRDELLRLTNAGATARVVVEPGRLRVGERVIDPAALAADARGLVLHGFGSYDPPTSPLDQDGQGIPYACYAFAAQIAQVEVDTALGTVAVRRIVAAHDVGRAINPLQVEGQIHGGIAQGLGLALMEEYLPGRTENLHDYLIPTIGDIPPIDVKLIEEPDPLGPYGAKGVGEPALIATAPAILNAIADATGVRLTRVPATPDRVLQALRASRQPPQ